MSAITSHGGIMPPHRLPGNFGACCDDLCVPKWACRNAASGIKNYGLILILVPFGSNRGDAPKTRNAALGSFRAAFSVRRALQIARRCDQDPGPSLGRMDSPRSGPIGAIAGTAVPHRPDLRAADSRSVPRPCPGLGSLRKTGPRLAPSPSLLGGTRAHVPGLGSFRKAGSAASALALAPGFYEMKPILGQPPLRTTSTCG
jgi:hypothetical protein